MGAVVFLLLVGVIWVAYEVDPLRVQAGEIPAASPQASAEDIVLGGRSDALAECEEAVRAELLDPESALFVDPTIDTIETSWRVSGAVDSETSSGALLRTYFVCRATADTTGSWDTTVVMLD